MKKKIILFFILLLTAVSAFTLEFSLRPGGFVFFPAGTWNMNGVARGYPKLAKVGGQ